MGFTTGYPVEKMLKDRTAVLVRGNRSAETNVPEILKSVCQFIIPGILIFPEAVPFRELLGTEGREPEQVVGALLNHVDPQIIASVYPELRP